MGEWKETEGVVGICPKNAEDRLLTELGQQKQMKHSETKPNRLDVWGDSMLNKLPSCTRKKRKRQASKKRRVVLRESTQKEKE